MTRFILTSAVCVLFISCTFRSEVQPQFNEFYFMNFSEPHCIALKYNGKDTVYQRIEQSVDTTGLYYHVLTSEEKDSLTQWINQFPLQRYRSKEINVYTDTTTYFFIAKRAKRTDLVCVYGNRLTPELKQFGDRLKSFCATKPFLLSKKEVPFWGKLSPIPPPPPPPPVYKVLFK
ncbi:MAG: hypothetical protein RL607_242 [Bacteroidota bacterium]